MPITRPTLFAEVGSLREDGHGRASDPLDNNSFAAAGRARVGPKGAKALPFVCNPVPPPGQGTPGSAPGRP